MAIEIKNYPNIHDSSDNYETAYVWNSMLTVNPSSNSGSFVLTVNPNEASWQEIPIGTIPITLGQVFGPGLKMPSLAEFMQDPEFAAAHNVIGLKLYQAALAVVPALAGGKIV